MCPKIVFAILFLILIITKPTPIQSKTNQEPVNFGFVFSMPWDISNTLRAPVAGPLSIVLASGLALICFAGLLFAPVWWIFGLPPRKYHLHSVPTDEERSRGFHMNNHPYHFLLGDNSTSSYSASEKEENQSKSLLPFPDFTESIFLFIPPVEEGCKKLLACHAHGFLPFLPGALIRLYHSFSKKILNISGEYKAAVVEGLEDQGNCRKRYDCTQDIVTLAKSTLFYNIPSSLRDLWKLEIIHN